MTTPDLAIFVEWLTAAVPTFLLVFSRTMGLFLQAPVISSRNVPNTIRVALMIGISLMVMYAQPSYIQPPPFMLLFIMMALQEFMVGAIFGFAANFMFLAIQSAGELAGVEAGMSAASVMNPFTRSNVNAFGTLYFNIGM